MSRRTAEIIRWTAGICLIAVALPATRIIPGFAGALLPLSVMSLISLAGIVTWGLLLVGGAGLVTGQRWAFVLVYLAALTNIGPGFAFVPLSYRLVLWFVPTEAVVPVLLIGANGSFVGLVAWAHVVLRRGPGSQDARAT